MKKLAIITTHPIQYYAPVFKLLHERGKVEIKVYFTWGEKSQIKHEPGFGKLVKWDLPLVDGYPFEWVHNIARNPGSHEFYGIKTPGLIGQITEWDPDAVLVFGWAYQSHLQILRFFKNKLPVYFRGDSTLLDEKFGLRLLFKTWLLKWVYNHVDDVFYVGTANKKYFLKHGIKNTQLSFSPHAVDNDRFAEDRSDEVRELRSKLGLSRESILVLFAGKFEIKKDPVLLLHAFLKLDNPNIHLLFAGSGPLDASLKSHASTSISMTKQIHFIDFQNQTQMPVLYQACDLFCLPSRGPGESWGLAVNEAMACDKAILVSDKVGSAYDLVKEGRNGFIFKSGDVSDLKEKLEHLTSCKRRLQEFGNVSREIIKEWNFEPIAVAIEKQLMNEPQR